MRKTIAAIAGGVVLGITVAFASAGAFQFPWGSDDNGQHQPAAHNSPAQNSTSVAQDNGHPAPPNAPEPNETPGVSVSLPSWAPLVKRVMPSVVHVAITEEVKSAGPFGGPEEEGPGGSGGGDSHGY
jgi:S1-C subfamily serine protease